MQQRADPCPGGRLGLELIVHLQGGVVHLLAHGIAGVGGGSLLGLKRVGGGNGGLHIGVVGHDLLLERGVAGLGCCPILCGDLIAIAAVGQQVGEGVTHAVEGVGPVVRVGIVAALGILIPDALGGLLVGTGDLMDRDLVDICGVGGQHRIVRDEGVVHVVVKSGPLGNGGVQIAGGAHLEQMSLHIARLADGLGLKEVDGILHRELLGQLDVGVDRDDGTVLADVADGKVGLTVVVFCKGVGAVQVVQASCHAVRCDVAVVGGIQIDDIGSGVAHKGTGLLGHGDQIGRGHHMVGVIQIDLAHSGDVGLHEDHAGGELQGKVGVARQVLHEPGLVLVGNEHAGAAGCTGVVVDGGQQGNTLAGRGSFAQQHRGDLSFLNAVVHIGVYAQHGVGAVERLGGRDHDALLVGASLLIGGVLVGAVAVRADAQTVVVPAGGVAVAVVGEGVGKAVAALVHLARGVLPGGADVEQLVVIVGAQILDPAKHSGAVLGEVAADIECRAGEGGRNHGKRHRTGDESRSNFLLQRHNSIDPSLVHCRHFVGRCYNTPILMKIQVFPRNFSIYSFLYGIYSYCVFHLPLRERKTAPVSYHRNRGGSYTLLVLSQALTQLLAGVLDSSLSGCQNCRAFVLLHHDINHYRMTFLERITKK